MRKLLQKKIIFIIMCISLFIAFKSIPYSYLLHQTSFLFVTQEEFKQIKNTSNFMVSNYVVSTKAYNEENDKKISEYDVKFKLFNLFNIKNLKVVVSNDSLLYAGGECIGVSLKSKGVIIVGSNYIITKNGNANPFKSSGLNVGDVITEIDGKSVNDLKDITNILNSYKEGSFLILNVKRKNDNLILHITPAKDIQTNKYKLGLWVRNDAVGVGTLTFVNENNSKFGSLGHAIVDADTGTKLDVVGGEIYKSNVIGIKKGTKGVPGELMGLFSETSNPLGKIYKNSEHGVYGTFIDMDFLSYNKQYEIGGRLTAKPGKAKILSCINGVDVKEYNIEIIKTNYQHKAGEKSMVIKITDKELIEKTGGIVQGMSGSPIIQDGKIIGAVTHVFVNEPTKGFGLYLDWMILE